MFTVSVVNRAVDEEIFTTGFVVSWNPSGMMILGVRITAPSAPGTPWKAPAPSVLWLSSPVRRVCVRGPACGARRRGNHPAGCSAERRCAEARKAAADALLTAPAAHRSHPCPRQGVRSACAVRRLLCQLHVCEEQHQRCF